MKEKKEIIATIFLGRNKDKFRECSFGMPIEELEKVLDSKKLLNSSVTKYVEGCKKALEEEGLEVDTTITSFNDSIFIERGAIEIKDLIELYENIYSKQRNTRKDTTTSN